MVGGSGQDGVVGRGVLAEDDFGTGSRLQAQELRADGNAAIGADLDLGAQAPDKGPPRAVGFGAQHRAFFFASEVPGLLRSHFEFAVDLVLVVMEAQGLDLEVGWVQIGDVFTGEVSGQAVLPELMLPFDFAFGLGSGRVAKSDAVEVERLTQFGQGMGIMRKEQRVIIGIDFQRQTIFGKSCGEQIEIGQEDFALIELGAGEQSAAIVEHIDHRESLAATGKPAVGRGIQLPELTDLAALPAPDWSGRRGIGFRVSQLMLNGPAPNLGAMDFELA